MDADGPGIQEEAVALVDTGMSSESKSKTKFQIFPAAS